jgi:archaellum component FlaC
MPTAEDYARELIGRQAIQIIGLRAQLDTAQEHIRKLEKQLIDVKGGVEPAGLRAVPPREQKEQTQ